MSLDFMKYVYSNATDHCKVEALVDEVIADFLDADRSVCWDDLEDDVDDDLDMGLVINCEGIDTAAKLHDAICEKLNHSGLAWDIDSEWDTID